MRITGITRNVVVLGLVSFFTDLASEMLYPIIPLFITGTGHGALGLDKQALGLIEGTAEGISTGLRWIGGILSDLARKRKPFVLAGYTLSALSKPIMGLAAFFGGAGVFLTGRASDRLGKSIRTAARDALIADATAPEYRGVAFGLHRAMDTCGAVLGPLMALLVLWLFPQVPLAYLFFIAVAPGLASSLLTLLAVNDIPHARSPEEAKKKARFWQHYPAAFWQLLIANALFSLGNSSDSFLIVRSTDMAGDSAKALLPVGGLAAQAAFACLLFAAYNVVYAVAATPFGKLSDRIGRKPVVAAGWLVYGAVYAGFALLNGPVAPWVLFCVYGLYQALTEGVSKALVSDLVGKDQRAGAIGLYYTVAGLGQFVGSALMGIVWQHVGVTWAFLLGTIFPLLAIPLIATVNMRPHTSAVSASGSAAEIRP